MPGRCIWRRRWRCFISASAHCAPVRPRVPRRVATLFTALSPPSGFGLSGIACTAGGVFAGSALWWLGLVSAITGFRTVIGARAQRMIDRVAGVFFLVFGGIELRQALTR
ncbi:MAG: hypothetical protein ACREFK_20770 [Stellaceae bacterium]